MRADFDQPPLVRYLIALHGQFHRVFFTGVISAFIPSPNKIITFLYLWANFGSTSMVI